MMTLMSDNECQKALPVEEETRHLPQNKCSSTANSEKLYVFIFEDYYL